MHRHILVRIHIYARFRIRISVEYPQRRPRCLFRRCISMAPLWKGLLSVSARGTTERSVSSVARKKMRFPFEFLHLNEAGRIRGRNEGKRQRSRDTHTHTHTYVDVHAHIHVHTPARDCISNSLARTTVVFTPSSRPRYSPPLCRRSFSSTFQPRRPPRSLIYLFPRVSRRRLGSFFLFIVASLFPFFAHFVRFPPEFCCSTLSSFDDDVVESSRL